MKRLICFAVVILVVVMLPVGADNPGRLRELEAQVKSLQSKVELLELETSNMESYINFILSDAYIQMVCQECR